MRFARLTGVIPARLRIFSNSGFRVSVSLSGFFIGHPAVGSFRIGRDYFRCDGYSVSGGFARRWDARDGEIIWRHWFEWHFPLVSPVYRRESPTDISVAWTGRAVRVIGFRWGLRWYCWGSA